MAEMTLLTVSPHLKSSSCGISIEFMHEPGLKGLDNREPSSQTTVNAIPKSNGITRAVQQSRRAHRAHDEAHRHQLLYSKAVELLHRVLVGEAD